MFEKSLEASAVGMEGRRGGGKATGQRRKASHNHPGGGPTVTPIL